MKINKWAVALLVWGLAFRAACAYFLQPGFDEAYYSLYSLHPDWSYFDHPPLVAWVAGFGIWLTGQTSQFTIRIGTLVLYVGTLLLFYLTSARLFSSKVATLTLAIATSIPFFQVGFGILVLPDSPLMFFWAATLYLAACEFFPAAINSKTESDDPTLFSYKPSYRLAGIGLLVGLACLGKYHGFLLGLGLIIFCLLSPNHRVALRSPQLLGGIGLFALAISPVLVWNLQHDWASFRFQAGRAVPQAGYNLEGLLVTFLAGIGYLFPTFGLPLWWVSLRGSSRIAIATIGKRGLQFLDANQQKQLFILSVSLPIFLGFTLMGGYRQILPSWHMPGFFGATLLLGQQAAIARQKHPQCIRNWLWGSGVTVVLLMAIALLHVTSGIVQKGGDRAIAGGFWSAKDDPSTQLIDVQQLRQGFTDLPVLKAALAEADFAFSNNFFIAGQIGMAIAPLGKPITCFDADLRGFAFWSTAQEWVGKKALYVTSELFQEPLSKYDGYFQAMVKIADIPIVRSGQVVQLFHVYRTTKLLKPYPRLYGI